MAGKAGDVTINLSINAATFSQGIDKGIKQLKEMGGQADSAGAKVLQFQRKVESASHGTVSGMQAASGAIRLVEGDITHNIRAVERFITTIPGVGAALQAAFPLVGVLALGGAIFSVGEKVVQAIEKINAMPQAIERGFEAMHQHARLSNDELAVTNDKLSIEIAKLEGKPENGLALALDEARVNADKLTESAERAEEAIEKLLKANNPGMLGTLLGKAATDTLSGGVNSFESQLVKLAQDKQQAYYSGDTKEADRLQKDYVEKLKARARFADEQVAANPAVIMREMGAATPYGQPGGQVAIDNSANRNIALGLQKIAHDALDQVTLQEENAALEATNRKDRAAKDAAEKAKQAAEKYRAAMAAIARAQMADMEREYAEMEKAGQANVFQTRNYWDQKLHALQQGSANYDRVNQKVAEATKRMDEVLQKSLHHAKSGDEDAYEREQIHQADEQIKRLTDLQQRATEAQRKLTERGQLSDIGLARWQGEISKYQALVDEAQVHAAAFAAELADLDQRLAQVQGLGDLPGMKEEIVKLQAQKAQLQQEAEQQAKQDRVAIEAQTADGAFHDALRQWEQQSEDTANLVRRTFTETATGINESLARALTDPARTGYERMQNLKQGLSNTFRGIANQGIEFGLGKLETGILGAFHIDAKGKPTGEKSNPLWVAMASSDSKTPAGFFDGMPKVLGGKGDDNSGGGGIVQTLGKMFGFGDAGGTGTDARPTGAPNDPISTKSVAGGAGGIMSLFGGGGSSSDGSGGDGGSGGGGFLSFLGSLFGGGSSGSGGSGGGGDGLSGLPGFASGGPIPADVGAFIVGERGPEILNIGSRSAHVTPNSALRSAGGGGDTHHTWNIDARGATDPAMVHKAVHDGIMAAAPHIAKAAMHGVQQQRQRNPLTAR